jgi:hypothetical protein
MNGRRRTGGYVAVRWAAVGLAWVAGLDACGGDTGHHDRGTAEQTGGSNTSGSGGVDTVQAGNGGGAGTGSGKTSGSTATGGATSGGASATSGGTSSSAAGGTSASSASGATSTGGTDGAAGAASGGAPGQAGTGGTGGRASGGAGGTATGGAGTDTGGTSGSAAAAGSAGAAGTGQVSELIGTWESMGYIGDCIDERMFLTFREPDQVSYADWNDDACTGPKLLSEKTGTFVVVAQHTLEITWDLSGDPQAAPKARCVEEYPFALGVSTKGTPGIIRDLFVAVDERTWQYRTVDRCYDSADVVLDDTVIDLEVGLDAPLPLTGSGDCQMTVSAEVVRTSTTAADDMGSYSADLYVVPCVIESQDGVQRIRYAGFVGAESVDEYQIWQDFLDEQGYPQAHPDWVLALLNGLFFPDLTLQSASATCLCEAGCMTEWVQSEGMTTP